MSGRPANAASAPSATHPPIAAAQALLHVDNLSFSYPGRHVFTHWSAQFQPGLTWLQGSNGSGKSTLLKLLAGVLPPLTGQLNANGVDAASRPLDYRREVFWCGSGPVAFDHLRAPEYFAFLQGLYPHWDGAALSAHLQALGLADFMSPRLSALSTGTQRKVWLAATLVVGTAVVLVDEPLNALDTASAERVRGQLALATAFTQQAWLVASHQPLQGEAPNALVPRVLSLD